MPSPLAIITEADAETRSSTRGGAGTRIIGGVVYDVDHNKDVRGSKWFGEPGKLGIAGQMEREPYVRTGLRAIRSPIIGAHWVFEPASKDPLDVEIADFCTFAVFECTAWREVLRTIFNYLRDGFSMFEVTDDVREIPTARFPSHPGKGSGVVITGFHQRPAWSISQFHQSRQDPTKLQAITQYLQGSDGEDAREAKIPADRLLRFTWEQEGADFTGLAPLRSAYAPWKQILPYRTLEAIAHERQHVGIPTVTLGANSAPDDKDKIKEVLAEVRSHERGYLVFPPGTEFEWSNANTGSAGTDINRSIERCGFEILLNLDVGFLLLGQKNVGSFALAASQEGHHFINLETHAAFIADRLNLGSDGWSLTERIVRMNYGAGVALPHARARNLPTRDWSKTLPLVHNLTISKHITPDDPTEDYLREIFTLPKRDEATSRKTAPTPPPGPLGDGAFGAPPPPPPPPETESPESPEEEDKAA